MRNLSFIWFVGAVVWWIDAAVAVHYRNKPHAILAEKHRKALSPSQP
jgi:hypothetical protein